MGFPGASARTELRWGRMKNYQILQAAGAVYYFRRAHEKPKAASKPKLEQCCRLP